MMDVIFSNITFIVKKTFELDKTEILQLNDLYNEIFKDYIKIPRNEEVFVTWAWFEDQLLNRYISFVGGEEKEVKLIFLPSCKEY